MQRISIRRRGGLLLRTILGFTIFISVAAADRTTPRPQTIKVGMLLTLSGKFASAGEDCRLGIKAGLAAADVNQRLEVFYADSMNDPKSSVSEFRKLVAENNVLAVYTHRSSIGMALNPISLAMGIPLLGAVAHEDFTANNKYAIQVAWSTDTEGYFVADEFIKRGYKRAALIVTEDDYTNSVAKNFKEKFVEQRGSIVFDEAIPPGDSDFRSMLLQLKSKSVDAIYLDLLLPHIAPMIKQVRELGINIPIFGNFYFAKEEVRAALGNETLEGVEFVDLENDLPELKARLTGERAVNPPGLTVMSYIATVILAQAAQANSQISSPQEFWAALVAQQEVRTPDRVFAIKDRIVQLPLVVKKFRGGKINRG